MNKVVYALAGLAAVSSVSAFVPQANLAAKAHETRAVCGWSASRAAPTTLSMTLLEPKDIQPARELRRNVIKSLVAVSFLFSPASYAAEEEEEEEEEAPKPKKKAAKVRIVAQDDEDEDDDAPPPPKSKPKKKSKKTGGIRTDTFELADITKDPAVGPDGAPNPKTSNPIRRKTTKEKKDEAKKRGLPSTDGDSQSDKPTPRNIFSFLPGQVDIPIITK